MAGVVGSGSAPSLWEAGNKGPYSASAASAPFLPGEAALRKGDCGTLGRASRQPLPVAWLTVGDGGRGTGRNEPGKGEWKACSRQREEPEQMSRDKEMKHI